MKPRYDAELACKRNRRVLWPLKVRISAQNEKLDLCRYNVWYSPFWGMNAQALEIFLLKPDFAISITGYWFLCDFTTLTCGKRLRDFKIWSNPNSRKDATDVWATRIKVWRRLRYRILKKFSSLCYCLRVKPLIPGLQWPNSVFASFQDGRQRKFDPALLIILHCTFPLYVAYPLSSW